MHGKSCLFAAAAAVSFVAVARAEFAAEVVEFDQGNVTYEVDGLYQKHTAVLHQPQRITDEWLEPINPFVGPYEDDHVIGVGVGGTLTVRLAGSVPVNDQTKIGVFTSAALNAVFDAEFNAFAESPARTLAGREYGAERTAEVLVGNDPDAMVSLGRHIFAMPGLSFTNLANTYQVPSPGTPTDFDKPFTEPLSALDGMSLPQIIALFDGSAGGTWIDVDEAELLAADVQSIAYVQIRLPLWQPINGDPLSEQRVSAYPDVPVKYADVLIDGINVVPEPASAALLLIAAGAMGRRQRRM